MACGGVCGVRGAPCDGAFRASRRGRKVRCGCAVGCGVRGAPWGAGACAGVPSGRGGVAGRGLPAGAARWRGGMCAEGCGGVRRVAGLSVVAGGAEVGESGGLSTRTQGRAQRGCLSF